MTNNSPGWRDRVVDRSLARSAEAVRARGVGPATRILEAATALSRESDGGAFSIQQVVERADVALKTFYRHFGSKDALLLAMLEESIHVGVREIARTPFGATDPMEQLRIIVIDCFVAVGVDRVGYGFSVSREHSRLLELFPDEMEVAISPYAELVESAILRCQEAGSLGPSDAHSDAEHITHLVLAVYHRLRLKALKEPPEVAAERCWEFCSRALRSSASSDSAMLTGAEGRDLAS